MRILLISKLMDDLSSEEACVFHARVDLGSEEEYLMLVKVRLSPPCLGRGEKVHQVVI